MAAGLAKREDFWLCVGYSGWAPGQLQMEYDQRSSWYLASADSGTLLKELLRQAKALPPPSAGETTVDNGCETWEALMQGIGREKDVREAEGSLAHRMLGEWCRAHLMPKPPRPTPSSLPPKVAVGALLATAVPASTGTPADRFLLRDQFLHKALLLVVAEGAGGTYGCIVLNRPTANIMEFKTPDSPRRRVPFCATRRLAASSG